MKNNINKNDARNMELNLNKKKGVTNDMKSNQTQLKDFLQNVTNYTLLDANETLLLIVLALNEDIYGVSQLNRKVLAKSIKKSTRTVDKTIHNLIEHKILIKYKHHLKTNCYKIDYTFFDSINQSYFNKKEFDDDDDFDDNDSDDTGANISNEVETSESNNNNTSEDICDNDVSKVAPNVIVVNATVDNKLNTNSVQQGATIDTNPKDEFWKLKEDIDSKLNTDFMPGFLAKLVKEKGVETIRYYLDAFEDFAPATVRNTAGFLYKMVMGSWKKSTDVWINKAKQVVHNVTNNAYNNRVPQRGNFDQREYDDAFYDSLYDNIPVANCGAV